MPESQAPALVTLVLPNQGPATAGQLPGTLPQPAPKARIPIPLPVPQTSCPQQDQEQKW